MYNIEHPDITSAEYDLTPNFRPLFNHDTLENRINFIENHADDLVQFLMHGNQDVLDAFFEESPHKADYQDWIY